VNTADFDWPTAVLLVANMLPSALRAEGSMHEQVGEGDRVTLLGQGGGVCAAVDAAAAAGNRKPAAIGIVWGLPGAGGGHRAVRPRQVWPDAELRTQLRHLMA
jgi:hypothetical protein